MHSEQANTVRSIYAHWAEGDFRHAPSPYDPEVVWTTFAGEGDDIVLRGLDAVRSWFREFFTQWRDFRIEADEIVERGDRVLVLGHQRGQGATSGATIEMPVFSVWTFRDGRVVEVFQTRHRDQALAAVEA